MSIEEFELLIIRAYERLPLNVKDKIKNVAFLAEEDIRIRHYGEKNIKFNGMLLGLYEGIPRTKRDEGYSNVLPDKITIFKNPIEHICEGDQEKMKEMVYQVLWHEVGHYFGFNEEGIRRLEHKRFGNKNI
jgi:predicted Zn-dependent protease with MMP-like domain